MFDHFVITRFNLTNFLGDGSTKREAWISWTRDRLGIFKKYCLPSMLNQINTNFKWLIYFDSSTPDEFLLEIQSLNEYPVIQVYFADGYEDFHEKYIQDIRKIIKNDWVITTWLDNDDCLHDHAIDTIQGKFIQNNYCFISLSSGYVYNTHNRRLSKYYYPMAPFVSLIEKTSTMLGVFHLQSHTKWRELNLSIFKELFTRYFVKESKRKAIFVLDKVLWMQIYHQNNVSNSFYRGLPVVSRKNLIHFGMDQTAEASPIREIFKYCNYVWWKRYFKATIVNIFS